MKRKILSDAIRLMLSGAATAGLAMSITSLPLAAHAQTTAASSSAATSDSASLPEVTVTEQSGNTNQATTGIARLPSSVKETPKIITVVPQEIIEQQRATSLEQILKNVPGITMSTGEGNGGANGDQFRMRGLSAKGDIYVDGLRDFGAYKRDSFNIDSVQVIKGPSGESFGVGNVGGLINQTTKKANLNTSTSLDQSFSSGSTHRTTVDSNFQINDTSAIRINAMVQDGTVADRNHVKDNRNGVAIDFGTGIGTSTEWHLNYSFQHNDGVPDYGVPMAQGTDGIYRPLTEYNVPGYSNSTSYVRSTDKDESSTHMLTSTFMKKLGNGITINNDTRLSVYERDFSSTNPASISTANLRTLLAGGSVAMSYGAGGGVAYHQRGWAVQNVSTAKAEFNLGGLRNQAMLGLDVNFQRDERFQGTWTGRTNNQTVVNPSYDMTSGASVTYGATTRTSSASDVGLLANDRLWLSKEVSLLGSLRWDHFHSEYATNASTTIGGEADSNKLSPALSAIWEPSKEVMVYTSAARTYRPIGTDIAVAVGGVASEVPSSDAINNPERSDSLEAGFKLDLLNKRVGLTGAVFQIKKSNSYTIDPDTGTVASGFSDSGEGYRIRGVEMGLTGHITSNWSANLAYSHLDGKVTYSSTATSIGKEAPGVPHDNLTLWTSYDVPQNLLSLPGRLSVGGGVQYASAYWVDSANTGRIPSTVAVNAMLSYKLNKYRISLNAYNLTNHLNYSSYFGTTRAVPTSGRTFTLNIGTTF
jgi:catecholate siderophore receptor